MSSPETPNMMSETDIIRALCARGIDMNSDGRPAKVIAAMYGLMPMAETVVLEPEVLEYTPQKQ